ncbi:MAG: thioredoxin family protein [Chthoniobacteraceae bacterium]
MKTSLLLSTFVAFALSAPGAFAKPGWEDEFDKGVAKAKSENKMALVDFTGSDWCVWCIKLDKEIFSKQEFKDYAKENLVLVEVDFPQLKPLPKEHQERNNELAKKYEIEGYPTVVVLSSEGKEIGRLGYMEGGPKAFVAALKKIAEKNGAAGKTAAAE